MTFSIIGTDDESIGIGTVSGSIAVGKRVPWVEKGVGAIATQAYTETMYGEKGLELLEQGLEPKSVLESLFKKDPEPEKRQVGILKKTGAKAVHTGHSCPDKKISKMGQKCIGIGNMLQNKETVLDLVEKFRQTDGKISIRLLKALKAGAEAGGDIRGNKTAALLIKGKENAFLEIDRSNTPVQDLEKKVKEIKS